MSGATSVMEGRPEAEGEVAIEAAGEVEIEVQEAPAILAKGLAPSRPQQLEYSAPSETGGVERGAMIVEDDGIVEVDPNASRAERRRAERANRKRR